MDLIFSGDAYDTPPDFPSSLMNNLFLKSRLGFFLPFFRIILKYRSICKNKQGSPELWVKHSLMILKAIEGSGGRFHLEGLDNLRKIKEPLVVVSNHMSSMETMIYPALLYPFFPITFVVKRSLQTSSLFGDIMMSHNTIGVERKNPREDFQKVLSDGAQRLKEGISVVIFPQATRETVFSEEKFNSLGIKLARRANVKIMPAALKTDFWGNGKIIKDIGPISPSKPIHFAFGEPMELEGNGKKQHQKCIDFIKSHTERWNS